MNLVDRSPPKPKGIFWDLLAGDHMPLSQAVMEHPENYDDRLVVVVRELIEGRKKLEDLDPEESSLLNRGTVEFMQFRPAPQTPKAPPPQPRKTKPSDETKVTEPPPIPDPGVDVPETPGGIRPYWWI